jgi:hypothetical protein
MDNFNDSVKEVLQVSEIAIDRALALLDTADTFDSRDAARAIRSARERNARVLAEYNRRIAATEEGRNVDVSVHVRIEPRVTVLTATHGSLGLDGPTRRDAEVLRLALTRVNVAELDSDLAGRKIRWAATPIVDWRVVCG